MSRDFETTPVYREVSRFNTDLYRLILDRENERGVSTRISGDRLDDHATFRHHSCPWPYVTRVGSWRTGDEGDKEG